MSCSTSISGCDHESQMSIWLPAGGGDRGCLGGISVGVVAGVPVPKAGIVGDADREGVPELLGVGVFSVGVEEAVVVGCGLVEGGVFVSAGPGYVVGVSYGPGYVVADASGPGYCDSEVAVAVGVAVGTKVGVKVGVEVCEG
jgi:hypothetical protein